MIINNINDNGSGPWGGGNNQNPWGKRPNSNGTPPDVDQMLKESKDKLKKMVPTGEIDTQIKYHQEQKEICEAARQISIVEKDGQKLTVMHQNTRILRKIR